MHVLPPSAQTAPKQLRWRREKRYGENSAKENGVGTGFEHRFLFGNKQMDSKSGCDGQRKCQKCPKACADWNGRRGLRAGFHQRRRSDCGLVPIGGGGGATEHIR